MKTERQEKLIRIAWKPDKTIEVMSDFTKKVTIERLTIMGRVLEHNLGVGIEFIRYNKVGDEEIKMLKELKKQIEGK